MHNKTLRFLKGKVVNTICRLNTKKLKVPTYLPFSILFLLLFLMNGGIHSKAEWSPDFKKNTLSN